MALVLADRVLETSTSEGLGTFALAGAQTGYQTFSNGIGNGNTCYYTINGQTTEQWEVGIGTVGAGTLARTTLISSNTGSFINFVAGVKNVFVTYPAEKSLYLNADDDLVVAGQIIQGTSTGAVNGSLQLRRNITGGATAYSAGISATIQDDVTGQASGFSTFINTVASSFTLNLLKHYNAVQGTIGSTSAVTNQYGFFADAGLTGATNNYGFYGNIASGTNRFNFAAVGTAANVFVGTTSIGGIVGAESLRATPVASAVNYLNVIGAITTASPAIQAAGSDTNIGITLTPKGTGKVTTSSDMTVNTLTVGLGANNIADNTAVGYNALSGVTATNTGSNVAVGYRAGQSITGGSFPATLGNTAIGTDVMSSGAGLTGYYNTGLGYNALLVVTTGYGNTAVGQGSGLGITTGNNNTILGSYTASASPISATGSNFVVLSDGAGTVRQTHNSSGAVAFDTAGTVFGTSGQVLTSAGSGAVPTWTTVGTMSTQNANAVAITGGAINGTTVGATTPAVGTFTTLSNTGTAYLGGLLGAESLRVTPIASAVNYLNVSGAVTTGAPVISAEGSDANIGITLTPKGTGKVTSSSDITANTVTVGLGLNNIANNTAVGYNALSGITTTNAGSNVAVGYQAGQSIKGATFPEGFANTAIGYGVMGNAVSLTGYYNSGVGYQSLLRVTTGFGNTGIGASSGLYITTGNNNVILGSYTALASPISATGSNFVVLSDGAGTVRQTHNSSGAVAFDTAGTVFGSSGQILTSGGSSAVPTWTTVGTMSTQNANAVAITGGAIDGTTVGSTTAAAGSFTTLAASGVTVIGTSTGAVNGSLQLRRNITGGTTSYVAGISATVQTDVTGQASGFSTFINTAASSFTLNLLKHYNAQQGTIGATSALTNQYGFFADSSLVGATNNYGFYSDIASGTNRFNFAAVGTAANVFVGTTSIGGVVGADSLRVTPTASAVNYLEAKGAITTAAPSLAAAGSDTNIGLTLSSKGTGSHSFYTNGSTNLQLAVPHVASAVNYLNINGGGTSAAPQIYTAGTDSAVGINLSTKGTGAYGFYTNTFVLQQFAITRTGSVVNYLSVTGSATGNGVPLSAVGSDTNIDIKLTTKGTGVVSFGTYTAGILAQAGYITIKDAAGNTRNLLVG